MTDVRIAPTKSSSLGWECRGWCNSLAKLEVLQLTDENVGKLNNFVYADDSVHYGNR